MGGRMKISTKGRYALRLALDIAANQNKGPVSLHEVSERQAISLKYLEQLASLLSHGGLLISTRGAHGGYNLAKPPEEITAGDVLRLSEGDLAPVACLKDSNEICPMRGQCATIKFWEDLGELINDYVDNKTLADLTSCPVL